MSSSSCVVPPSFSRSATFSLAAPWLTGHHLPALTAAERLFEELTGRQFKKGEEEEMAVWCLHAQREFRLPYRELSSTRGVYLAVSTGGLCAAIGCVAL